MYLISYIILYPIIMLMSRMPFWLAYKVSDLLYFVSFYLIGYRKKVVFSNLRLVFPDKTEKEIYKIAQDFYQHFADILMETVKAFSMDKKEVQKHYHIINPELLQNLGANNKSVILIGSHYANWEWMVQIASYIPHKSYGTYNKIMNPYFDKLVRNSRGKFGAYLVTTQDTIPTIIKNHEQHILSLYTLLSDQSPMVQKTVYWNKFMGIKVPIHIGAETLSKKYDLAVVYFSVDKIKRGYYEAKFTLLAENPRNFKDYEITDHFLKIVEDQIKQKPSLYFWSHRRWKHKDKAPVTKQKLKVKS